MPRQRKSPTGELRTVAIPVYMSPSERQDLGARAGSLSLSEYLLVAGLGQSVPRRRQPLPVPELNRLMYLELEKVSRNLNQMVRACHIAVQQGQGCNVNSDDITAIVTMIQRLRLDVIAATIDLEDEDDIEL